MLRWQARSFIGFCVFFECVAVVGCGPSRPTVERTPTRVNLERLGAAYSRASQALHRPPVNQEELLPFLKQQGNPEEILRSTNDGQDFVIVWGVDSVTFKGKGNEVPVIAYEKSGKDGIRHVLRAPHEIFLLSEAELRAATFPAGYTLPF